MTDAVRDGYDAVAEDYAERVAGELAGKPLDRALLTAFAESVRTVAPDGVIADVGCGPGHVAAYLAREGARVVGVDVSPAMVEVAQRRSPELSFAVGSVLGLDMADASWSGAVAMYSLIHFDDDMLDRALAELRRVLRPEGLLLVALHTEHLEHPGETVVHVDDWWGHGVDLDFRFRPAAGVRAAVERAGFVVAAQLEREPYDGAEAPTRRLYLLARRPA